MKKRLIALVVITCMLSMLLTGCKNTGDNGSNTGKNEEGTTETGDKGYTINTDSLFPVINEPGAVTLDITINVGPNTGNLEDLWFYKWLEKKSGVNLNITGIVNTSWNERKAVAMASGDMADIYLGFPWTADEIVEYGMNQGHFLPLNEYIDQYGDQINYIFDYMKDADMEGTSTCPDGKIYHLPSMGEAGVSMLNRTTYGMSINTTWLDKLKLPVPATMEELYNTLVAFKNQDPNGNGKADEMPFSAEYNAEFRSLMLGAYGFVTEGTTAADSGAQLGITGDLCNISLKVQDDGSSEPVFIPMDPDYKEYLTMMNKFYTEGLLDPDFFTEDTPTRAAKNMEGVAGAIVGTLDQTLGDDPDLFPQYRSFLVSGEQGKDPVTYQVGMVNIAKAVITSSCKYPDVAVRLLNALYDPQVMLYNWNGPDMEDEENYDDYAKELGVGFKVEYNEDGTFKSYTYPNMDKGKYATEGEYLDSLVRSGTAGNFINGIYGRVIKYNADPKAVVTTTPMGWFRASQQQYNIPHIQRGYPIVYLDTTTSAESKNLKTPIEDYVYQMEAQFINGSKSIDTEYDKFISELKALGVEKYLKIYADAYEKYISGSK